MAARPAGARGAGRTASYRLALGYLDLRVSVRSSTQAHLDWLTEFLTPSFTARPQGEPHCVLTLTEDGEAFRGCLEAGPDPGGAFVDCFALDSRVIRLRRWTAPDAGTAAYDEEYQVFYRVSADRRTVELVSPIANPRLRTPLMRVVRELAMNRCAIRDRLVLHAAAVRMGSCAVIVAGRKGAGKTTILIHLLTHGAPQYLANDRVVVDLSRDPYSVRGMPSVVTIRPGTLERFSHLRQQLLASGYDLRLTLSEAAQRRATPRPFRDGRYGLSPRQLCELLGGEPVPDADAGLLLFPELTGVSGAFRLSELDPAAATARLSAALLQAGSWRKSSDLFLLPGDPSPRGEAVLRRRCRAVAEKIPALRLELGTEAYGSPALADALLARTAGR